MSLHNQSDHTQMLSIREAVLLSGYTSDYLNRLCKRGIIRAQKIDAHWMVEQVSLNEFIATANEKRQERSHKLSEERKREYGTTLRNEAIAASTAIQTRPAWNVREEKSRATRVALAGVAFTLLLSILPHMPLPTRSTLASVHEASEQNIRAAFDSVALRWYRFVSGSAAHVAGLFIREETRVTVHTHSSSHTSGSPEEPTPGAHSQTGGLVVVPVLPNDDIAAMRRDIELSFSDEVVVTPVDETSGIITPVFRSRAEDEYLYVMVPMPPP